MGFDDIVTSVLLLIAAYTFLWPRARRSTTSAQCHAQRAQPGPRRAQPTLRTSVQPVTSYGALAYVITAYCAVVVVIVRDIAQSCAGAWQDVLAPAQPPIKPVAQLPPPTKQVSSIRKPTLDDDFADSRAKVAAWNYVAPKREEVQEKADLGVVQALEPPVKLVRSAEPLAEPVAKGLTDARRKAIARAVEAGISANMICDLVGGTRAEVLAFVRMCKSQLSKEITP